MSLFRAASPAGRFRHKSQAIENTNLFILQIDLKSEKKREQKLMILVQASARVPPYFVRQVIYNIVYPLGSDWRWLRP